MGNENGSNRNSHWTKLPVLIAALGIMLTGCQFSPPKPSMRWPWKQDSKAALPDRILAVWADSVLHQSGQSGVRGFGGRIYFYQSNGHDPIKVDGGLAVYVFDANELNPLDQKPLRKFLFTADQFAEHAGESSLGPSYSVWIPIDEVGGQAQRLSLIVRFEGREGGTVISDPAIKMLPGLPNQAQPSGVAAATSAAIPIGYQRHTSEPIITGDLLKNRNIQTIDLPPNFKQHVRPN